MDGYYFSIERLFEIRENIEVLLYPVIKAIYIMTSRDKIIMLNALKLARTALKKGNFPSASVLYDPIEERILGSSYNTKNTSSNYANHSELKLLLKYSKHIKIKVKKNNRTDLVLYTTIEPCLMCLGFAAIQRIDRIVYGIKDINAGATHISPPKKWYNEVWPIIEGGMFVEDIKQLVNQYMELKQHFLWK